MSLQTRTTALAQAVGADIKDLRSKVAISQSSACYCIAPAGPDTALALSTVAGPILIGTPLETSSSDGTNPDFVRNADGTVTVKTTGTYQFSVVANAAQAMTTGQQWDIRLRVGNSSGSDPLTGTQLGYVNDYAFGAGISPTRTLTCEATLAAGQKIGVYSYQSSSAGWKASLGTFAMARVGGAKGDKGDTGAKGDVGGNATVPIDPWHIVGSVGEPAFQNSWTTIAGYQVPAFRKDPLGRVWIKGVIQSGVAGQPCFVLPSGYWPKTTTAIYASSSSNALRIDISTTGQVVSSIGGAGAFVDIDLSFDTETVTAMPTGPTGPTGPQGPTGGNATVPMDTWHTVGAAGEPAFANSWVNYVGVSNESPISFTKDPLGRVRLRGFAATGTLGATGGMFTLPAGYRPPGELRIPVYSHNGTVQVVGMVLISPSGVVNPTFGHNFIFSIDGIEFDTATITAMPTGPAGAQGAKGDPGSIISAAYNDPTAPTVVSISVVNATWTALPLPSALSITSSDGTTPDFTRNADGSLTINRTGMYQLSASVGSTAVYPGSAPSTLDLRVVLTAVNKAGVPDIGDSALNINRNITHNGELVIEPLAADFYATAGQKIGFVCIQTSGSPASLGVLSFGIARFGAGPAGAQGPKGDVGGNATVAMDNVHYVGGSGEPAFQNGWVNYDNGAAVPGSITQRSASFRKDPLGKVSLFGTIRSGANGTVVFTLPSGYWPKAGSKAFTVFAAGGAGYVDVGGNGNGTVTVFNLTAGTNVAGYVFLDGVEFDTETVTAMPTGPAGAQGAKGDPGGTMGSANLRQTAQGANATLNGWAAVPIGATLSEPSDAFSVSGNAVTVKDAGWYHVSAAIMTGSTIPNNVFIALSTTGVLSEGDIANSGSKTDVYPRVSTSGSVKLAAGAKVYLAGWSNGNIPFFCYNFSIERIGGPKGDKGDPGNISLITTLDWNTALTSGFYYSSNDILTQTVNGPGSAISPPNQAGIVSAHANGLIAQRVWDLDKRVGYTRYKSGASTWTSWVPELYKPIVAIDVIVGGTTPQDGDERYFQNAAMKDLGIMWKFRYDGTAPAGKPKWVFVGGSPIRVTTGAALSYTTGNAAYAWGVAMPTPQYAIPISGDYMVDYHVSCQSGTIGDLRSGMFIGDALVTDSEAFVTLNASVINANLTGQAIKLAANSGAVVDLRLLASVASAATIAYTRAISFLPIRLNL